MTNGQHPEWLTAALDRIRESAPKDEVVATHERAEELGVTIGTTVRHFMPMQFRPDPQAALDDFRAMDLIRAGLVDMPLRGDK